LIFPLLKITEEEQAQIEEDPDEFVNCSNDICVMQESGSIKTTAASVLVSLC